uniref:LigA n=1 Tax=Parastrongyloides trichosuri TaxID=131310 RepID=A0A0N4ZGT2_PARTI
MSALHEAGTLRRRHGPARDGGACGIRRASARPRRPADDRHRAGRGGGGADGGAGAARGEGRGSGSDPVAGLVRVARAGSCGRLSGVVRRLSRHGRQSAGLREGRDAAARPARRSAAAVPHPGRAERAPVNGRQRRLGRRL